MLELVDALVAARRRLSRARRCFVSHRRNQQHVRAVVPAGHVEILGDVLAQHRRRERPEALAELDLHVHHRLHVGAPRIAEDAARTRARAGRTPCAPGTSRRPCRCGDARRRPASHSASSSSMRVYTRVGRARETLGSRRRRTRARAASRAGSRVGCGVPRLVEQLVPDERAPRRARRPRRPPRAGSRSARTALRAGCGRCRRS